jgi:hypothetical protein
MGCSNCVKDCNHIKCIFYHYRYPELTDNLILPGETIITVKTYYSFDKSITKVNIQLERLFPYYYMHEDVEVRKLIESLKNNKKINVPLKFFDSCTINYIEKVTAYKEVKHVNNKRI